MKTLQVKYLGQTAEIVNTSKNYDGKIVYSLNYLNEKGNKTRVNNVPKSTIQF